MQKKKGSFVQPGHINLPPVLPGKKGIWFAPAIMAGIIILVLGGLLWAAYNFTYNLYVDEFDANIREAAGMIDRSGNIYGILSMAQDISVQKESEEKIRRQHEFLHNATEHLHYDTKRNELE